MNSIRKKKTTVGHFLKNEFLEIIYFNFILFLFFKLVLLDKSLSQLINFLNCLNIFIQPFLQLLFLNANSYFKAKIFPFFIFVYMHVYI